jgi:hypothetical protein
MKSTGQDSLKTRRTLTVGGKAYDYFSIPEAAKQLGDVTHLPVSLKVLLENVLRFEDGRSYKVADAQAVVDWQKNVHSDAEVPFKPSRILMQDFTGVPAVVDLAAMRDGILRLGSSPQKVNPLVPVDLVIDHSVMVDVAGTADSLKKNVDFEYERNGERYTFLRWGSEAFENFRVVPPGAGICHQVNIEYLAEVVWTAEVDGTTYAYPDSLYGTDSHTTMANGLGILGWGVGGIEAEAAMLGQPADRQAAGRGDGHRPGADGDADAAEEGRGRQIRRILWPGVGHAAGGGSGDDRQHGAGIWRDLRVLPGRSDDAGLFDTDRARPAAGGADRGLSQGAGHVPGDRRAGAEVHRHAGARFVDGAAEPGWAEAAAGSGVAVRRVEGAAPRTDQEPGRAGE